MRWLILVAIAALEGCASLAPPPEAVGNGINLEYLFGVRRPAELADTSLVDNAEYMQYLEWKRWQDFKAYQEWKRRRDEQGTTVDSTSN